MRSWATQLPFLLATLALAMGDAPCGDGKACPEKIALPYTSLPRTCMERDLEKPRTRDGMVRITRRIRCESGSDSLQRHPAFCIDTAATPHPGPLDTLIALDFCGRQGKRLPSEAELRELKSRDAEHPSGSMAELLQQCVGFPPSPGTPNRPTPGTARDD